MEKSDDRRVVSFKEWEQQGTKLFGKDKTNWKFVCPNCGGVQTYQEFKDLKVYEGENKFYYSCIGRWDKKRGCDWTLGGLFHIHTLEVINEKGKVPVFEFAKTDDLEKKP